MGFSARVTEALPRAAPARPYGANLHRVAFVPGLRPRPGAQIEIEYEVASLANYREIDARSPVA